MNLPTLRQLRYLTAVVEERHFGRAAEKCFVTQSTLSAGIQELEAILGTHLIERTKRSVRPTSLGLEIAEDAQTILDSAEAMVRKASSEKAPLTRAMTLGVIPTIGPFLLPRVLPRLRAEHPDFHLRLVEDQTERLLDRTRNGELDASLLALPYDVGELKQLALWDEGFSVALPSSHPLNGQKQFTGDSLPADELMLLEDGHCLREHALSACQLPARQKRSDLEATSLFTLIQMVASGDGITLLPDMCSSSDLVTSADVVLRPLVGPEARRGIGLVWRKAAQLGPEMEALAPYLSMTPES